MITTVINCRMRAGMGKKQGASIWKRPVFRMKETLIRIINHRVFRRPEYGIAGTKLADFEYIAVF